MVATAESPAMAYLQPHEPDRPGVALKRVLFFFLVRGGQSKAAVEGI